MGWDSNPRRALTLAGFQDLRILGKPLIYNIYFRLLVTLLVTRSGGGGGIRTHETLTRLPVFKTGRFNHSRTPPQVAT